MVAIEDNKFVNYAGNYDYYKDKLKKRSSLPENPKSTAKPVIRDMVATEKRDMDLSRLEGDIKFLEDEIKGIDGYMSVPEINHDELNRLYCKREELNKKLDEMLEVWIRYNNLV